METVEEYLAWKIEKGYTDDSGFPLKCEFCEHDELEDFNFYYLEHIILEYSVRCKNCGKSVGHWAYGSWEV